MNSIHRYLENARKILDSLEADQVVRTVSMLFDAWCKQKKIFIMGNGGSASTASHMANDLSKATIVSGKPRMRVFSLTDSISLITAWANDTSYDQIFSAQLENVMNEGDVIIGISASGNSPNILRAFEYAKQQGNPTIGWSGLSGGKLKDLVDHCLHVPSEDVGMIEGIHLILDHVVTEELRRKIMGTRA